MYYRLFSILIACAALLPALYAAPTEQGLDKALQQAVNKGAMNNNMLLEVDFTERGARELQENEWPREEELELQGPEWQLDDFFPGEYNRLFFYRATPQEIRSGKAELDENGKYYVYSDSLETDRWPIRARAYPTGWAKTYPMHGHAGCKVYALGPQWLITSSTCPIRTPSPDPITSYDMKFPNRTDREIEKISVDKVAINKPEYFSNDHIVLLYVPQEGNTQLIAKFSKQQQKKPLRVIGFSRPQNIFALSALGKFYVHTSRLGALARDKKAGKLKAGALKKDTFRFSSRLNGTATDPLFFVGTDKTEYLTAFNAALEDYMLQEKITFDHMFASPWQGYNSNEYYALTEDDLHFIKETVEETDPSGWQMIKGALFLDTPHNPFVTEK